MSSFRRYGGLNRAATNNIVRNHYSNSDNPTISNYLGQNNSKIVSESHIDLSGNSILNVNGIYFDNGTTIIDGSFNGDLTVNGNLEVTKNTQLDGSVNVFGDVSLNSTLEVGGKSTFNRQIVANADVSLNSTLRVGGVADFDDDAHFNASMKVYQYAQFYNTINSLYIYGGTKGLFITDSSMSSSVTGNNNTGIGIDCMKSLTSGGTNACYGWKSGNALTTGQSNTLIGTQAGQSITDGSFNTALGYASGYGVTTGASNTLIGMEAGHDINTGSFNSALGYNAYYNHSYNYTTAIGYSAQPTGDHQIVLGTAAETVIIDGSLNVHGDVSFNSTLEVAGNVSFDASLNVAGTTKSLYFVSGSDYRIKTDVKPLDTSFSIDHLNPVTYKNKLSGKQDTGFIAHEVQEVFPHLVTGEKDGEQIQSLNYQGLIAILTREIQELKKRVEELENI